jgi:hypothetical protein
VELATWARFREGKVCCELAQGARQFESTRERSGGAFGGRRERRRLENLMSVRFGGCVVAALVRKSVETYQYIGGAREWSVVREDSGGFQTNPWPI